MPLKRNFNLLKECDLNLLIALSVLLKEAHVTKAAKELGLSQSAMSQVLKRLRLMFEDPLLVKGHNGMTLTNKAIAIQLDLKPLLNRVISILEGDEFNPATAQGRIKVMMNDVIAQLCITRLIADLNTFAPGIELEYVTQMTQGFKMLRRDHIDLIVGFYDNVPKPIKSRVIARYPWQMVTLDKDAAQLSESLHRGDSLSDESPFQLLRYLYQEHNQIHVINALKTINAEDASYSLSSGSLSTMIQALTAPKTATLVPHFSTRALNGRSAEDFIWLGEPIDLELKVCWNMHNRNRKLQKWFRKLISSILIEQLTDKDASQ
ncbi:LysR family transcriptional regulator [Shewanella violacea]|uniref:Transcriptional regulator, LysR family n=1 Tax=Shewanella violacea (strain JCM 10179 / CIP 106290 / LMG 19151 / DSS12) TaxID=637905 RepID=D4ZCW7_SHEVD|nr:LysR family transcriptional regulator [Shewanella violacea]BAJ03862.1 transcriptional regulator, LysR family [Shewanella violacea DSS12]